MLLEIKDIHVHYGKIAALKGISVDVDQGEIVTLIGANGAGKSTTLKTISGLRPLSSGRIIFDGKDISRMPGHRRVLAGIGQAPEGRGIFPGMTVTENLLMGAYARKGELTKDLDEVFELFPRLAERKNQAGGTMSGGEQQMLAIGRALMTQPKVLLLDEPSMGLAPVLVTQIFSIVQEINRRGTTVLLVEQNAQQALQVADRAYVLETGTIVKSAAARELLDDPQVRAAYLGGGTQAGRWARRPSPVARPPAGRRAGRSAQAHVGRRRVGRRAHGGAADDPQRCLLDLARDVVPQVHLDADAGTHIQAGRLAPDQHRVEVGPEDAPVGRHQKLLARVEGAGDPSGVLHHQPNPDELPLWGHVGVAAGDGVHAAAQADHRERHVAAAHGRPV